MSLNKLFAGSYKIKKACRPRISHIFTFVCLFVIVFFYSSFWTFSNFTSHKQYTQIIHSDISHFHPFIHLNINLHLPTHTNMRIHTQTHKHMQMRLPIHTHIHAYTNQLINKHIYLVHKHTDVPFVGVAGISSHV